MRELIWPHEKVAPRPKDSAAEPYVRCYLKLRLYVGILGIAVPVVLVGLERILFNDEPFPRDSLSAYYFSGMREVFVGSLCAIGVFLISYKVADRTRENRLSTYAGIAVILIALFPTGPPKGVPETALQDLLPEGWVQGMHYVFSAVFLVSLGVISLYFAERAPDDDRPGRERSKRYHRACAGIIFAALVLAAVEGIFEWPDKGLLIAEVAAVLAFGASWLRKGLEIRELLGEKKKRAAPAAPAVPPPTPS